jgi:hypothetical protein
MQQDLDKAVVMYAKLTDLKVKSKWPLVEQKFPNLSRRSFFREMVSSVFCFVPGP